ncbi:MAG: TetR/AcrR family transcriptional regulator [Pseudomonadota bacterium]
MLPTTDTRLKLMQTATELIWESNYDNVGIADICKKAGVTKGAFYHHFTSKADLFASACAYEWEQMRPMMDEGLSPRYTALQQVENVIELTLRKQQRRSGVDDKQKICGCPFFTAGAQAGCEEVEIRNVARDMSDNGTLYLIALVKNLLAEGYLQPPVNETQVARMLQQFVQGLLMHGRVYQDFDKLRQDLREGFYRLLGLDPKYRTCHETYVAQAAKKLDTSLLLTDPL